MLKYCSDLLIYRFLPVRGPAGPGIGEDSLEDEGRWHDNRHTLITDLAESVADDETIRDIAGMLKHYSHIRMEAKRTALESIGGEEGGPEAGGREGGGPHGSPHNRSRGGGKFEWCPHKSPHSGPGELTFEGIEGL
jgi:hypothetical protein